MCASLGAAGPLPNSQPYPLERLPGVEYVAIRTREDVAVSAEWTHWTAQNRLGGIEPIELPGRHSPMLARPAAVANLLLERKSGRDPRTRPRRT